MSYFSKDLERLKIRSGREALCVRIVKCQKTVCDVFQKGLHGLRITKHGQKEAQVPNVIKRVCDISVRIRRGSRLRKMGRVGTEAQDRQM